MPFLGLAWSIASGGFGKLFAMIPAFLRWCLANPAWVICAVLGLLWGVASMSERHWHKLADNNAAGWNREIDKNKVNLASIATLQDLLNAKNAESDARAAALVASQQESASEQKRLATLAKADRSRVDALDALAAQHKPDANCPAPAALLAQIQGL